MTHFTCMCLNVTIDARQPTRDIKFNLNEDLKSNNCEFFNQRLAPLVQPVITVEHTYLVHKKQADDWLVHRCLNCGIDTHANSIRSKDLHVLLSQQLLNDPAVMLRLKESPDFSQAFGIVMHGQDSAVTSQSIPDPSSQSYESLQSVLNGIQERLNNFLLQEEEAMEERVRQFEEQQRSDFQQLQSKVRSEKKKMVNTLLTADRDTYTTTMDPSTRGVESSHRYSPKSPVESSRGISVPSPSKRAPLSRTRSTPVRKSQSPESYHEAPDSEAMFMLDDAEVSSEEPFYVSDEDDDNHAGSRHITTYEVDDQFKVRYFYTLKGERPSQKVQRDDKESSVESVVLWYIVSYKLEELLNFIKLQEISITRESDWIEITTENAESEHDADRKFAAFTDKLEDFAQDYSYIQIHEEKLYNTILSIVKSDPPDTLKSEHVVLVSNKKLFLVGHKGLLDDTRKDLIQHTANLLICKDTIDLVPAHEELVEKLCVIETLQQKYQVQINLTKVGEKGNLNITGTKENVQKCITDYSRLISDIKPESKNIPQTWVDLLKNKDVQDYMLEELKRIELRCVWRLVEDECKVLVYSLDSKTSREACTIICESVGERTYPKEICIKHEIQGLLKRHKSLLNISELDGALCIVGVRKIIENIDDMVKHQDRMQETLQQGKFGNEDGRGHNQVQSETGKSQQDKTGNTDGGGQSHVHIGTGKSKQDKTGNTDVLRHTQVQSETGIPGNEANHQPMSFPNNDDGKHIEPNLGITTKNQPSSLDQQPPAASRIQSHKVKRSSFNVLTNLELRDVIDRKLKEANLKCQWHVQARGCDYYLEILSDNYIVIRDLILQVAEQSQSEVSKPVGVVTEVRLHVDNDKLMYILEHGKDLLKNMSKSYGVMVNLENNDELVITGERESTDKAKKELMTLCKGILCYKTEVDVSDDLGRPEVTAKLRDLERKERCIIEFPGGHLQRPMCLHSWVYLDDQMTITITCGPVENASADVIVLPVNALGDIIGDSDDVKQVYRYLDQSQIKSKMAKEKILFLPNSGTLDCVTIVLAYVPEWTHEKQIDDKEFKKFDKLLKYAIDRGIRSVVIPVNITEEFPFSTFGCKLATRLVGQQWDLNHRLEIFFCTKTVYNGYLLKSKIKSALCRSDQGDKITEVLFVRERQLEIRRDLLPGNDIKIHVQSDSLVSMYSKVDVIVNSVGRNLNLEEGYVSKSLLKAGGRTIQDECTQNYPDGIYYGDVAVTGPGKLQCKMLCHGAILGEWIPAGNFSIRVLKSVLRKCLVETELKQYRTIAMPAVGTGKLGYPYHRVAEAMFDVVTEYQRDHQNTCITDVFFVLHQDDKRTLKAFEDQEKLKGKMSKKLYTARDDQHIEYIESCVPELQLRFQIFQLANDLHTVNKPEAVVIFDHNRNTDPILYKWNMDGNYLHITAHYDDTDDTFKRKVKEILEFTEENRISSVAFHLHLVTKSPVQLAEYVREIVYRRTFPNQSLFGQSTEQVYHYIRQIQFVVYKNTDIRSYIPNRITGYIKQLYTIPLEWHFVSYIIRSNNVCKVLAEDGATMKRVQDEVRRLVKKQASASVSSTRCYIDVDVQDTVQNQGFTVIKEDEDDTTDDEIFSSVTAKLNVTLPEETMNIPDFDGCQFVNGSCEIKGPSVAKLVDINSRLLYHWKLAELPQEQGQEQGMTEEGLSVSLTEEDYNAFRFFAASTSWYKAVEKCVKWEAGTLCIQPITNESKQEVLQLLKEISDMNTLDYPLTKDDELNKASDKCNEVQKEFQDVYLSYDQKDRNITLRSSSYESNVKAKYKLDLSFGRVKVTGRNKRFGDTKGMNVNTRFDKKEADDDISTPGSWNRKDYNVQSAGDITRDYETGVERLCGCLQEMGHRRGIYKTNEGIAVEVYSGSITNLPVDCIVNAANEQLAHGGGVAYAISRAAGYDFDRESRDYIQQYGQLSVAECCSTTAGNLPYKCVIHTVGPRWHDYRDKAKCLSDLQQSVEVTFKEAERMHLSSIAVPPISSGIFGVPKTDCAEQYYRAIVSYSHRHGQTSSLKEIHIIDIDPNMIDLIQRTFTQMLSSYDPTTVQSQVPNAQGNMDTSVTSRRGRSFPAEQDDHHSESSKQVDDRRANTDIEDCCICMDTPTDPKTLPKCGHTFCTDCIDQYFKVKPVCPNCGQVYGKVTGDQPDGRICVSRSYTSLPGYESCGSIRVTYRFSDGYQGSDHPSPGQRYKGFERSGHLPDNGNGRLVAKLLNVAFTRRLVFTIGRSRTTGQDGVLTWNDIHHKTRIQGGPGAFGYPDATYLDRVLDELAAKGVTQESADDPGEYREYTDCFRY